jgi:hypothetical protein
MKSTAILTNTVRGPIGDARGTVRRFAAEEVVRVLPGQPPSPVNAGELLEARWPQSP